MYNAEFAPAVIPKYLRVLSMGYNMHVCNVMHQKMEEKGEKERKKRDRVRQGDRYREHGRSTEGYV